MATRSLVALVYPQKCETPPKAGFRQFRIHLPATGADLCETAMHRAGFLCTRRSLGRTVSGGFLSPAAAQWQCPQLGQDKPSQGWVVLTYRDR